MRFRILTLGCKVNQTESAGLAAVLSQMGHEKVPNGTTPDFVIVNSCAVTAESVRKSRQLLRSLRRRFPAAKLLLTGCWPQAFPKDSFEDADFVTGTKERTLLLDYIRTMPCEAAVQIPAYEKGDPFSALPCADTTRTRAFLKVQDGCNQFCTYCIIPYARGRCRSMPPERLAEEARSLAAQGFREIVLTGINLGFFGIDTGQSLADAVRLCAEPEGICRVRLGSLEPEKMTAEILTALRDCEKFCPQFHLSLQSGSNAVLKRMHRRYTTEQYLALIQEIRRLFPESAVTTDVIVGFPGETEEDFRQTIAFVRRIGFAKVHVFPYSPREGTRAAAYPNQIPQEIKAARAAELSQLADALRTAHLRGCLGRRAEILIEGEKQQNAQTFYQGHTPDGTLVKIFPENGKKGLQNSLICATIEEYTDDALIVRETTS